MMSLAAVLSKYFIIVPADATKAARRIGRYARPLPVLLADRCHMPNRRSSSMRLLKRLRSSCHNDVKVLAESWKVMHNSA
jgi:hypothetical protein